MATKKTTTNNVTTKPEAKKTKTTKPVEEVTGPIGKVTSESERVIEENKDLSANLLNTKGEAVEDKDYFFGGVVPSGFKGTCGSPVTREDLVETFNKVFKPEDNILFYKQDDKEVYLIIIPIKYSTDIGDFNNSIVGDFQKHALSFLNEGSVNIDSLKRKLERVKTHVKFSDR